MKLSDPSLLKAFGITEDLVASSTSQKSVPRSIEELVEQLGPDGPAAAEQAKWNAVLGWIGRRKEAQLDPDGRLRLHKLVSLYSGNLAATAGLPSISGQSLTSEYANFHRSRQSRIKKAALALLSEWEAAGKPGLDNAAAYTFSYVTKARDAEQRLRARVG